MSHPTEIEIQAYQHKLALRAQRPQRHLVRKLFFNLFRITFILGAGYVTTWLVAAYEWDTWANANPVGAMILSPQGNTATVPMSYVTRTFPLMVGLAVVVGLFMLVALQKSFVNSRRHQVRVIARARRAQLYQGHHFLRFKIMHPVWYCLLIPITLGVIVLRITWEAGKVRV